MPAIFRVELLAKLFKRDATLSGTPGIEREGIGITFVLYPDLGDITGDNADHCQDPNDYGYGADHASARHGRSPSLVMVT